MCHRRTEAPPSLTRAKRASLLECSHAGVSLAIPAKITIFRIPELSGLKTMNDDVVLNSVVAPCYCSMFGTLGRVVSFEACCCKWALLVCKSLDNTLLFKFTVQKYIYPSAGNVHAGCFRVLVIHRTLTWTTGSLTCVRGHSYACVYTTRGSGTPTAS